ncbi:MAG: transglycosylase SLT domain-containing protein [Candidatus Riflebacteria bacterium]|nr:transglycosylase SLT domain-containing protein [Candidatus Riflebacteria bacterium]
MFLFQILKKSVRSMWLLKTVELRLLLSPVTPANGRGNSRRGLLPALMAGIFIATAGFPAQFESRLTEIHALWKSDQSARLIEVLNLTGPGDTLEDLRLYLLGESLKKANRDAEAAVVIERLIQKYPESWYAHKAGLSYILLSAKSKGPAAFDLLSKLAHDLPTPYMRGKALECLIDLKPSASREQSQVAIEAFTAYRSESFFYQSDDETPGLLKRIFSTLPNWRFTRDEWVVLARHAIGNKLASVVLTGIPSLKPALGKGGDAMSLVLEADALRVLGNKDRSLQILGNIISVPTVDPAARALAYQVRGDLFHFAGRHAAAVEDFAKAAQFGQMPVDIISVRYRLMRSAFEAGLDRQAENEANWLAVNAPKIPLLPGHLYEMALKRYDEGRLADAAPFFLLLARGFPGHYRADDALGYASVALGTTTGEGKKLLDQLYERYPNSFFLYWLAPETRHQPIGLHESFAAVPGWAATRLQGWKLLFRTHFDDLAREEIYRLLDEHPIDLGFYKAIIETAAWAGNQFQAIAYAERLFKNWLESGKSLADLPAWAWRANYPRPTWERVKTESAKYNLDPFWVLSIMREESHFEPSCLSHSHAMGLMQILPSTGKWIAEKLGIKGRFNSETLWDMDRNIAFGSWYLAYLRDMFNGDLFLGSAAYNGGQGNIKRKVEEGPYAHLPVLSRLDRVPLPETRDYYKKVMGSWWTYTRLYGK